MQGSSVFIDPFMTHLRPQSQPTVSTLPPSGAATAQAAPRRVRSLAVGGITPFTATDYPGQLAAVVFVQGCPWRCGYCHNPHLQPRHVSGAIAWHQVMALLQRRQGLIDAVVFSGGEPTTDPSLASAMRDVRTLGYKIGLHTGGTYPSRLATLLPLLDWVGMDVKAPFDRYDAITQRRGSGLAAQASLTLLVQSGVSFECRTTLHPDLLPVHDILRMAHGLADLRIRHYALQQFRPQGCDDDALNRACLAGYPGQALLQEVGALFPHFVFRTH